MNHSTDNKMESILIPKDLRIGQALIVSLLKSKHIEQTMNDKDQVVYTVTGTDPFYIQDKYLKKLLTLPPEETKDGE